MKKIKKKFIGSLTVFALVAVAFTVHDLTADAKTIYEGTVRLHVLANSDSEEDQALKLQVRDALLTEMDALLASSGAEDADAAAQALEKHIDDLTHIAEDTVASQGFGYSVEIKLSKEYYETRQYEDFALPAGEYRSLQVRIGKAEGENWWCVLFPPLCTSVASAEEELVETGFSRHQVRLLTDNESRTYKLKFKTLEWFGELTHKIREVFG